MRTAAVFGLFAVAAVVLGWLVRPFSGGPAASDAASSVLYFDRIASGRTLEAWLNTTPKPLLTAVYGVLHALDPGWTLVSLSAVLAAAAGVVLAAELARRIAGLAAAAFVAVALVGSVALGAEASWAYGVPWALAFWSAAGLMLLRDRARPGWAGVFLLFAALARPETFIVLGIAALVLVVATLRGPSPPASLWLLMIAWLALPVYGIHDLLLTGNPMWWLTVAPHAVEVNQGRSRSLGGTLLLSANHIKSMWILAIAAIAGGLVLLNRRAWVPIVGLVALGPLVVVYTWALAFRHIEVISHYYHPADMAIVLAAGVAVASGLAWAQQRLARRDPRVSGPAGGAVVVLVAALLGVVMSMPFAPLSAGARGTIALEGRLDARVAALLPRITAALPARASVPVPPVGPMGSPDPAAVALFIPRHRLPRMAVDLALPLTQIAVIDPSRIDLAKGYPPVDSVVYLDGLIDPGSVGPLTAVLRVSGPTTVGDVEIVPMLADPANRLWIVAVKRAP
jgi:hypothetical protein